MTYEEVLRHFDVKSKQGNRAQAVCPCHADKQASLTISRGNNGTLMYCHAGCKSEDIVAAVGLTMKDLFYKDKPTTGSDWKLYLENRKGKKIEAIYDYVFPNGSYAFTKVRYEGKDFTCGIVENNYWQDGADGRTYKAFYGSRKAIEAAISKGEPVFIVEGEKDVNSLNARGYIGFTQGSSGVWNNEFAPLFKNARVYILADNDPSGEGFANRVYNDLKDVAELVKIIVPTPDIKNGDISDFFQRGGTKEAFEKMLQSEQKETLQRNVESHQTTDSTTGLVNRLRELDARNNFETNDKSNAKLFATIYRDKHRYNTSIKDFMLYDGTKWVEDTEGLAARADAKILSDALIHYAVSLNDTDYLKAVTSTCNMRVRENMLKDARDENYFSNESLDNQDYLLNVQNGVLDLSENEPRFLEHSPDLLLSKICNVAYNPEATCDLWLKFLNEIMLGDTDKMRYLQKIAGLSLTGNTQEECCFILYGSTTRNGKSTFVETLLYMVGNYGLSMQAESLAVKQNTDSRVANGDIARLAGARLVNAPEPKKRMIFDTALLKTLLGRDNITARNLYQREFSFIPKFKLVINTNYLPTVTDDTVFSSDRIQVISFDRHFSEGEQDKTLKDRLLKPDELSGILNWCIEGLRLYRQEGLKTPQAVKDVTETYRADSDKVGTFVQECLVKSTENSKAKDIYEAYEKWCQDNGYGRVNKLNFFAELKTKGLYAPSGKVKGVTYKNVVKNYVIAAPDFEPVEDNLDLPFD